jgi:hypothetical protein
VNCAECLAPIETQIAARDGAPLCEECAASFYLACASCQGLIPREEAVARDGASYCPDCLANLSASPTAPKLGEAEVAALVKEFVRLHAEEKRLKERLEEIKEQLKAFANGQPRVSGAVILRAGGQAVKCSYTVRTAYNAERIAALEATVGTELIDTFFERKTSFSPIKESLHLFLAEEDELHAATRAAIRAAEERKEIATLNVIPSKEEITTGSTGRGGR